MENPSLNKYMCNKKGVQKINVIHKTILSNLNVACLSSHAFTNVMTSLLVIALNTRGRCNISVFKSVNEIMLWIVLLYGLTT